MSGSVESERPGIKRRGDWERWRRTGGEEEGLGGEWRWTRREERWRRTGETGGGGATALAEPR